MQFRLDYPEKNCARCEEIQEVDGLEPDCEFCDIPALFLENREVWEMYQVINTQFVRDFNALGLVFEIFGMCCTKGEARDLLEKLILIHSTVSQHGQEEARRKNV